MSLRFERCLVAWGGSDFNAVMKAEIESLDADLLPLQQALTQSSHAVVDRFSARVIKAVSEGGCLRVKAGLFYSGIVAGCSCADDPTPVDDLTEYCEVWFEIDAATGEGQVRLLEEAD